MDSNNKQLKKQNIEKNTLDNYQKILSALRIKNLVAQANKPKT